MSNKHTPGPWRIARSHEDQDGPMFELEPGEVKPIVRIYGADNLCVAAAHDLFEFNEANARLIAAAPELLAYIERIARMSGEVEHHDFDATNDQSETFANNATKTLSDLISMARDLLVKKELNL